MRSTWIRYASSVLLLLACGCVAQARPALWLYYSGDLSSPTEMEQVQRIWRQAKADGYTHILLVDPRFAHLDDVKEKDNYVENIEHVKQLAKELNMKIVPAVFPLGYSGPMLWSNPNLAEGLPVKDALFVVKGGQASAVADPPIALSPHPTWADKDVVIKDSVASVNNAPGDARFGYDIKVAKFHCYHVSVYIKTENFRRGNARIQAIAGTRELQPTTIQNEPTQDWTEHHVIFNSLDNEQVALQIGAWGPVHGQIFFKDWKIEEAGLSNVLRRPGTPVVVRSGDKVLEEGKDYQRIEDPRLAARHHFDSWHQPPTIKTDLPDGTELRVSWYHPIIFHKSQTVACPTDPAVMELLEAEAKNVRRILPSEGYMMSHDEMRIMGWDQTCLQHHETPGQILAASARYCTKQLAGSTVYVWSDMFDPFHNARKNYFLVNGDLTGSWEGLAKSTIIINWNYERRDESLKFFAERGHEQIIAAYYDTDLEQTRKWLVSAAKVKGIVGIMYTTWNHDYKDMGKFAKMCSE